MKSLAVFCIYSIYNLFKTHDWLFLALVCLFFTFVFFCAYFKNKIKVLKFKHHLKNELYKITQHDLVFPSIDINTLTYNEIKFLPGLSNEQARILTVHLKTGNKINNIQQLSQIVDIDENMLKVYEKIIKF